MSTRSDIIDGKAAASARKGLIYTCKCGWIDLGHARPDGALDLWNRVLNETGTKSKNKKGFKLSYKQSMRGVIPVLNLQRTKSFSKDYYIQSGLSRLQKESIALSIFMEVSFGFEEVQDSFPYYLKTDSGFSGEDLVSDLIGFYRAVRPRFDYVSDCKPVSKAAALKVWDTYGAVGKNKNKFFAPHIYPCDECDNRLSGPISIRPPSVLNTIQPGRKGDEFREWNWFTDQFWG